jgi:hypothetical protein
MAPDVQPKSQYKVKDYGRTDGKEGSVDKIKPNTTGAQTHSLA